MNLTAVVVTNLKLKPGEADRIWFDDRVPGFGLRIRESGSQSWIFQYKIGAKTRRLVIGQAAAIKVAKAREIAGDLHAKVRLGGDPAAERRVKIERNAHTFGALAQRYLDQQKTELRASSYREIARHLEQHAAPLHGLPVDTIDQRTIANRLSRIEKISGAVTANRVRATMSAMFGWGMREGLALHNPVANTNKRDERPRERVLNDTELRLVWTALGDNQYGAIIRLLILTGQRVNEIAGLRWSEVDFNRGVISLPGERTKNGRPHDIPMADTARSLLEAPPKIAGRDFVFGKPGAGPFSGLSRCKEALDKRIAELNGSPLPDWVHHDLRRSVATGMADIGIQPHIVEAVLNHVSGHKGGIAGIYNRAQYSAEKAQSLARWDEHVRGIVEGRNSKVAGIRGQTWAREKPAHELL
jgi:integrase